MLALAAHVLESRRASAGSAFLGLKASMLRVCKSLHTLMNKQYSLTEFRVGFLKLEVSFQFSNFTSNGIFGMLEAKDCQFLHMVFPSTCVYVHKRIRPNEDAELTKGKERYSELPLESYSKS